MSGALPHALRGDPDGDTLEVAAIAGGLVPVETTDRSEPNLHVISRGAPDPARPHRPFRRGRLPMPGHHAGRTTWDLGLDPC